MGDLSSPSWVIEAVIVLVGGRRHAAAGDKSARHARGQNDLAGSGNCLPVAGRRATALRSPNLVSPRLVRRMPPLSLEKHAVVQPQSGDALVTANPRGTTGFRRLDTDACTQ